MNTILETLLNYFCTLLIISAFIMMTGCSFKVESEYFGRSGINNQSITPAFYGIRGSDRGAIEKARY